MQKLHLRFKKTLWKAIKYFYLMCLLYISNACENNNDPSIETLSSYNIQTVNNDQNARAGEYLKDSIFIRVTNRLSPFDQKGFKVEFQVISGDGTIDQTEVVTRLNGIAGTRWKLGSKSFTQTVRARTYNLKSEIISELTFNAYAIIPNFWSDVVSYPLSQISDLSADTINQKTWMVSLGKIYKRRNNFLDWDVLNNENIVSPRQIKVDNKGVVYTGTWNGELFKSSDGGQSWIKCGNPIPDRIYFFDFWITSDGDLWAAAPEAGTWHSKDGGTSWSKANSGYLNGIYRMKNGWLMAKYGDPYALKKSEDDGLTWSQIQTPGYPYSFYVTHNDNIIITIQGPSVGIYKSTNSGNSFTPVHSVPVSFGTSSFLPQFHKYKEWYYFIVPGYGVLKTEKFEHFETVFDEPLIQGLFMDHTGSLIAKGAMEKSAHTFYYNRE